MIKALIDVLFENTCIYCGGIFTPKGQGFLCEDCLSSVNKYEFFEDLVEIPSVDGYEFFTKYEAVAREVILLYKFHSVKTFSKFIAEKIREDFIAFYKECEVDLITYVPVHFFRWWARGYDHNEEVLKHLGISYEKILKRVKYSRPLARYKREKRERLLEAAYEVINEEELKGRKVLVYDDILTTGSTAKEVARVLKEAGASDVYFYFFLRES